MPTYKARHCRRLSIHAEHSYQQVARPDITFLCPGVLHDHEIYCCTEHDHHVSPHVGCVLR